MLTTAAAAERLGVGAHEVRRLVAAGELTAVRAGRILLLDEQDVRRRARRRVTRGRALSPRTAWAAMLEASGEEVTWLDRPARSRLRAWLRATDPEAMAVACRRRAERHDLRVLPAYGGAVSSAEGIVRSGLSAAEEVGADLLAMAEAPAELYASTATLEGLSAAYGLEASDRPNVVIRIPALPPALAAQVLDRAVMPAAVVAVDLLDSDDVRTRRAGGDLLARCLAGCR
jgi:excisionase family DNA binding protein